MLSVRIYYAVKPLLPRRVQLMLRRLRIRKKLPAYADVWPVYQEAGKTPEGWRGWPHHKKFALVLTHDVETSKGQNRCRQLADTEERLGFRSAFYFVPRRYEVSPRLRSYLISNGFEVGVHGLEHDGRLYKSKTEFRRRAPQINKYLKAWGSQGFSSPCMQHDLEWILDLDVWYDISTYDTDPFEPQGGGVGTIFPFHVRSGSGDASYLELQYTLPQDFTLFVLMKERNIDTWTKKLDWISEHGGMVHLKTHPDYMNFDGARLSLEEYPAAFYAEFLEYVRHKYEGQYWHALPKDLARLYAADSPNNTNRTTPKLLEILCPRCRTLLEQKRISFCTPAGPGVTGKTSGYSV
jgi:hypothetical protein